MTSVCQMWVKCVSIVCQVFACEFQVSAKVSGVCMCVSNVCMCVSSVCMCALSVSSASEICAKCVEFVSGVSSVCQMS